MSRTKANTIYDLFVDMGFVCEEHLPVGWLITAQAASCLL